MDGALEAQAVMAQHSLDTKPKGVSLVLQAWMQNTQEHGQRMRQWREK
jgi:hypothetical protein